MSAFDAAPGAAFARVIDALAETTGRLPRVSGKQAYARCPAHEDHNPSLSVTDGGDLALVLCHGGCDTDDVLAALGLAKSDLFDSPPDRSLGRPMPPARRRARPSPMAAGSPAAQPATAPPPVAAPAPAARPAAPAKVRARQVANYPYCDESGEVLFEVVRYHPKKFRQRRPDGNGGWTWSLGDVRRVLYRLPDVVATAAAGGTVYVTEGEKDADAVAAAGATATCSPGGAGKWRPEYAEALRGARVVIVADRDAPGYAHAATVAASLEGSAASACVVESAAGKDAADHLEKGHTLEQFVPVTLERLAAPRDLRVIEGGGGAPAPGDLPGFHIPSVTGPWHVFPPDGEGVSAGLYRSESRGKDQPALWVFKSPFPEVRARIVHADGTGTASNTSYELVFAEAGDAPAMILSDEDLRLGTAWEVAPVPMPTESRIVVALASAIRIAAARAPRVEVVPRWGDDGSLHLPATNYGPPGYGATRDGVGDGAALAVWRELATVAADHPKVALVLGAAFGGVYVHPLGLPGFAFHLAGEARGGKTSALTAAAAVLGDPADVLGTFNRTLVASTAVLGSLAVLPAFVDEMGTSALTPAQLEAMVFRAAEGAVRTVGRRGGGVRRSAAWRSALLSSGNQTLAHVTTNPGLPARVVEVQSPITSAPRAADRLRELAGAAFGYPMQRLLADPAVDRMRELRAEALAVLDSGGGGVVGTLAGHLALCAAGADRLGELLGVPALGAAALIAAADVLDDAVADLTDAGADMGARLLDAVREAVTARPAAFVRGPDGEPARLPVEGVWRPDGRLAFLASALERLAREAGVDLRTALRTLAGRGVVRRGSEGDGRLSQRLGREWPGQPRVYVFDLGDEVPTAPAPPADPVPCDPVHPPAPTAAAEPVTPAAPEAPAPPPSVEPAAESTSAARPAQFGSLCVGCGKVTHDRRDGLPLHPACQPRNTSRTRNASQPRSASKTRNAGNPRDARLTAATVATGPRERPALVLLPGRLSFPGKTKHPISRPGHIGELLVACAPVEPRSILVHADALEWLGLPTEADVTLPFFADALAAGWKVTDRGWRVDVKAPGSARGVSVAFLGWDAQHVAGLFATAAPDALVAGLALWEQRTRVPWLDSVGRSTERLILSTHPREKGGTTLDRSPVIPWEALDGGLEQPLNFARPLTPDELEAGHVVWFDARSQYLAAWQQVEVGLGDPELVAEPELDKYRPGLWHAPGGLPRTIPGDPGLLPPPWDWQREWVTTPTLLRAVELLDDALPPVTEAWLWPRHSRFLRSAGERLRDTRTALLADTSPGGTLALAAVKAAYRVGTGRLNMAARDERSPWRRPDVGHAIRATARANLDRRLRKLSAAPFAILTDGLIFASDTADPALFAARIGLPIGDRLGEFAVEGNVPLTDDLRAALAAAGSAAAVKRAIDAAVIA